MDKVEGATINKDKEETWGMRWTNRPDGLYELQILLPSGRVVDSGMTASVVRSTLGHEEYLVAVVSKRSVL